jgi:hypothetical protein
MILDLNALAVESFETDPDASPAAAGGPTREVILCAVEDDGPQAPTYPYPSCGCVDL